ncbi:hypothetical protein D9758_008940 [Tetrapyrgos nigripes]|uniref:4-coumarate--CoA ligase n=1 Tax=Tetrapyrgos nigripes TaxID=182062 RepID=A0A8H5LR79_9AGAR|nr:hypothetical protein D9758_008940 [Tetrapyrgos nigripes]
MFHSLASPLYSVPDNLTIPQFLFDKNPLGFLRGAQSVDVSTTQPCMIDEISGRQITFSQAKSRSDALARALKSKYNLSENAIVSVFSPNHMDYPICIWATHRLGAIVSPMSASLTESELEYHLGLVKCTIMFVHHDCLPVASKAIRAAGQDGIRLVIIGNSDSGLVTVDQLAREGSSFPTYPERSMRAGEAREKVAFLSFSSGTTGMPKAVMISHFNVICNILQIATFHRTYDPSVPKELRRFKPGEVCTGVLPLYHIYGLVLNLHFVLFARMTLVVTERFDFERMLKGIEKYRISYLWIVPPQAILFCKHPAVQKANLSSVKYCLIAGAPATGDLFRQLLQVFPEIHLGQGYGLTESSPVISMFPLTQKVGTLGSAGQLVSGTTIKIVTSNGTLAKFDQEGELYVKGGQITLGYYQNAKATEETFIDGWLRTGDIAIMKPNGDIFIIDRLKELIKVKGLQVAPAELEGHLLDHPYIADVAVIGVPDEYSGELPRAYVVLHDEQAKEAKVSRQAEEEIRVHIFKHVADAKAKYKWLQGGIIFLDVIPKSPSGKILRRVLRGNAKGSGNVGAKL